MLSLYYWRIIQVETRSVLFVTMAFHNINQITLNNAKLVAELAIKPQKSSNIISTQVTG